MCLSISGAARCSIGKIGVRDRFPRPSVSELATAEENRGQRKSGSDTDFLSLQSQSSRRRTPAGPEEFLRRRHRDADPGLVYVIAGHERSGDLGPAGMGCRAALLMAYCDVALGPDRPGDPGLHRSARACGKRLPDPANGLPADPPKGAFPQWGRGFLRGCHMH
jgi:hypothetical protein